MRLTAADDEWFAEKPLVEAAMEQRTPAQVFWQRTGRVLLLVVVVPLVLVTFTSVGALAGEINTHPAAMAAAGSAVLLLPLAVSFIAKRRYFRPRWLLTVVLVNALLLLTLGTAVRGPTRHAIGARGGWWLALVGNARSSWVQRGRRWIRSAANLLR